MLKTQVKNQAWQDKDTRQQSAAQPAASLTTTLQYTPLTESVQLVDFQGETEAKVWAGCCKPCLDKKPFEKQLSQHCLFSPRDYATSEPPCSHQRPPVETLGPYAQRNVNIHLASSTWIVSLIFKGLKVGSTHNFKLQYRFRTFAKPEVLQKDPTWISVC